MSEIAINKVSLAEYTKENEKGLILDVDLEYPQNYTMVTTTTHLPPEKSVFLKICFQIIVKKYDRNTIKELGRLEN